MIKAIFFDLDETLCNTNVSRADRAELAYAHLTADHPDVAREEFLSRVLEIAAETGWPRGVRPVLAELGLDQTEAGKTAIGLWFFEGCVHLLSPFPGVEDTIQTLSASYVLGVITNGNGAIQRRKFEHVCIQEHFKVFLASEDAGCAKPDPAIFALALSRLGIRADEAVMVGDHLEADIGGAKAAGLRSVWFNPYSLTSSPNASMPDAVISHFDELPDVVARLQD